MKNIFFQIVFFIILSNSIAIYGQNYSINKNNLIGCWIDSYEENLVNSEIKIFRHCDYKVFPISRYRYSMVLNVDSTCSWLKLMPNDAHKEDYGVWRFDNKLNLIKIFDLNENIIKVFEIAEIDNDIMRIYTKHNNL